MIARWALLACLGSTLYMTGLIWFVDRVHYPMFARIDGSLFREAHAEHSRKTAMLVFLPMVVELASAAVLVARRPVGTPPALAWLGLAAALVVWGATAFLSVPEHEILAAGFDAESHRRLVRTDLVRLVGWTIHAAVVLTMTARALKD